MHSVDARAGVDAQAAAWALRRSLPRLMALGFALALMLGLAAPGHGGETSDPAVQQEQASLEASSRALREQAGADPSGALLEQGPRHPRSTPLLNLGF